jgi:hypothetical protein
VTDFRALLQALAHARVRFIIVGGAAATAHGSARLTHDLDVVYDRSPENLRRVATALAPHEPYLRGAPPGLPFTLDEQTLAMGLNFTLTSKLGDIDLLGEIVGGGRYGDLEDHTVELRLFGITCLCLDIEKLIEVKRAAGRPKDLEVLAELAAIRDSKD